MEGDKGDYKHSLCSFYFFIFIIWSQLWFIYWMLSQVHDSHFVLIHLLFIWPELSLTAHLMLQVSRQDRPDFQQVHSVPGKSFLRPACTGNLQAHSMCGLSEKLKTRHLQKQRFFNSERKKIPWHCNTKLKRWWWNGWDFPTVPSSHILKDRAEWTMHIWRWTQALMEQA